MVRRRELKADGSDNRAEGIKGIHEMTARLEKAPDSGDEETAQGEQGDHFDQHEANMPAATVKVQEGWVGFVR